MKTKRNNTKTIEEKLKSLGFTSLDEYEESFKIDEKAIKKGKTYTLTYFGNTFDAHVEKVTRRKMKRDYKTLHPGGVYGAWLKDEFIQVDYFVKRGNKTLVYGKKSFEKIYRNN